MIGKLCNTITPLFTRRDVLRLTSCGFGWLAFRSLAAAASPGSATLPAGADVNPLAAKPPHFTPRAKRVIFLCMRGGPSHLDTFDYKPKLVADTDKPGQRPGSKLLGSKFKFKQHGQSGHWVSELFPELARQADQLCLIPSMQTDLPAHPQAYIKLHTGTSQFIRPSLGAWTLFGLGTENQSLPGFVSITPASNFGGVQNYGSGFLPAVYQGTRIGTDNRPISNAEVPNLRFRGTPADQRAEIEFIQQLNRGKLERDGIQPDVEGAIASYELAFKMQSELPGVLDLNKESAATRKLYGIGEGRTDNFGRKCLLARRLVAAGVRFVEITHGNWDHHFNLSAALERSCGEVDKPIAGLLTDLHRLGLLKDTLVVWTGEFGRTPYAQGTDGRDHNNKAFTLWMAGGGVKPGTTYGQSDDYGHQAVDRPVSIHDLHATLLAFLGLDHERLTFRYAGRDFRLTDVHGDPIQEIMA
ncbi:MAG TPA: DUF1501 domain-containing protein [Gemmatales bacterium]|nr:DUF1501 domain-containing protein [Gemmatales bacterium]HMP60358.1 DUF1501 domain-containing protein [Gemmatales bacterium]